MFLPIVMSLWGLTTLMLNLSKELNAIRDKILTGTNRDQHFTVEHCQLMLENDWKPLTSFLILICSSYGIVTAAAPYYVDPDGRVLVVWLTSWFVSLFGFMMALLWGIHAPADYRMMKKKLEARSERERLHGDNVDG